MCGFFFNGGDVFLWVFFFLGGGGGGGFVCFFDSELTDWKLQFMLSYSLAPYI